MIMVKMKKALPSHSERDRLRYLFNITEEGFGRVNGAPFYGFANIAMMKLLNAGETAKGPTSLSCGSQSNMLDVACEVFHSGKVYVRA